MLSDWIGEAGSVSHFRNRQKGLIALLIGRSVAEVERDLIIETLRAYDGNRTRSSKMLAISVRTLRNKINEYEANGLNIPAPAHGESELFTNR